MTAPAATHPRVGIAAIIPGKDGKLVLGKRLASHGAGMWQFPGGHLEFGETYFACAEREALEETGLRVKAARLVAVTNDLFEEVGKHYVTIFVLCEMREPDAEPKVLEPEKCEGWYWVGWDDIRAWSHHHHDGDADPRWADKKLFLPIRNLIIDHPQLDITA